MQFNLCSRCIRYAATAASALKKPAKFYRRAVVVPDKENKKYNILLDDKRLKSPMGKVFETESEPLAYGICQEWNMQHDVIRLDRMLLTKLFFTATDNPLSLKREDLVRNIMDFLETDTILCRNNEVEALKNYQEQRWDPIVEWASAQYHLTLKPAYNIVDVAEVSVESKQNLRGFLFGYTLNGLIGIHFAVESIKSLLLTLAVIQTRLDVAEAVELSLLEQRFQMESWGKVEWAHGVEYEELLSRLSAAALFINFSSNIYRTEKA